jgi:hypothetical protein
MKFMVRCSTPAKRDAIAERFRTFTPEANAKGMSVFCVKEGSADLFVKFIYQGENSLMNRILFSRWEKRMKTYDDRCRVEVIKDEDNGADKK